MRAREPDDTGYAVVDGVRTYYEVFGTGPTTLLMMGTFPVVDGRQWKGQVPYLARHFRVVTWDPRGNGASDRPAGRDAYADVVYARDAAAVLDATGTDAAFVVALCSGVKWSLLLATAEPKRVRGLVAIAPGVHPLAPNPHPLQPVDQQQWCGDFAGWVDCHSDVLSGCWPLRSSTGALIGILPHRACQLAVRVAGVAFTALGSAVLLTAARYLTTEDRPPGPRQKRHRRDIPVRSGVVAVERS